MKNSKHPFKFMVDVFAAAFIAFAVSSGVALAQVHVPGDPPSGSVQESASVRADGGLEDVLRQMDAEGMDADALIEEIGSQSHEILNMLNLLPDAVRDQGEFADIEEIAKLQRELMRLDLEHRKAVLVSKIKLLQNDGVSETASLINELRSELELMKGRIDGIGAVGKGNGNHSSHPAVLEIIGNSTGMEAVLLLPNIGQITVRNGSVLPNGMKVESVDLKGVTVRRNGESMLLSIGMGFAHNSGGSSIEPTSDWPSGSAPDRTSSTVNRP